ncbi:MAG: hypothetical protein E6G55_09530 [Actinobacteria bacterium]|nr:MAG: hypothetical protein E6G55_09530 [Actinomycetota bacterium]
MINDTLDTSPSFAPKMAARRAPDLSAVRCSVAIGPGCGTILHCRPRTRRTIEESIETRALVFRSSGERPEPMSTGYEMAETGARVRVFVLHGPLGLREQGPGEGGSSMRTRRTQETSMFGAITGVWWLFLITGVAWLIIALIVLRFDVTSITTVGVLLGIVFIVAGLNEFMVAVVRRAWKWAHTALGVLFLIGAILAFAHPRHAFWTLASVLGILLVLKGSLDIIASTATKDLNELWGLGLVVGILEVLLGFWASQQFFPARAALILIWVGFAALFRGIMEIVLAFHIRNLHKALTR